MTVTASKPSAKPAKGLGKGLAAMMGESYSQNMDHTAARPAGTSDTAATPATGGEGISTLPVTQLFAGPYQPRRQFSDEYLHELADSIEKNGIVQPILVRASTVEAGKYEIIAGERRWRAAKLAKLVEVPVLIREVGDQQALEMALIENIQRQDLNALEEAMGYQRLMDEFDYTQEQLASAVGKSRSHIANLLRLQSLAEPIKAMIDKGLLSAGHARALLGVADAKQAEQIAERIWKEGLSVRQTEQLMKAPEQIADKIKSMLETPQAQQPQGRQANHHTQPHQPAQPAAARLPKSEDVLALEEMLSGNLGLRVSIDSTGNQTGEVVISYSSLSQLDEILRRLGGSI